MIRATVFVLLLVSCGGGSSDAPPLPPIADRSDLLFGYFGDCDGCIAETNHANLANVVGWGAPGATRRHAIEAVNAHQKILLAVCWFCPPGDMESMFGALRADGTLSSVVALYPQDEPDLAGMTAEQVRQMILTVRAAAAGFEELAGVPVAAIYGSVGTAGSEYFDWIGRDFYGHGPLIPIRQPNQRLILVPGGADPWKESPAAFIDAANRTPAVVAIMPFIWRYPNPGQPLGIADNGMRATYCAAGQRITQRVASC